MKEPAYLQVYNILRDELRDGEYKPGTLLPAEHSIMARFGISRTTVRRALEKLCREGYINPQQGRGTLVLDFSTVQRLNALTSISETLSSRGHTVTARGMHVDKIAAPKRVADALRIREGDPVLRVQRVQCADNAPICIMTNFLTESLAPGLESHVGEFTSLYAFLEQRYHVELTSAVENISADKADFQEAQILQVPVGTPLLISRRVTYRDSEPVEYAHIKILADKYEYSVYMEGRP